MGNYPRMLAYDRWANLEVLPVLHELKDPPARSVKLIAHIIGSQYLWHVRVSGVQNGVAIWPEWNVEQTATALPEISDKWTQLAVAGDDFLRAEISYANSKGERWTSRNEDILMHLVMHGAYHRGQISSDVRTHGFDPAYTDFIQPTRAGLL